MCGDAYSGEGGGALLHNDADAIEALLYAPTLNNEEDAFRNLLIRKINNREKKIDFESSPWPR